MSAYRIEGGEAVPVEVPDDHAPAVLQLPLRGVATWLELRGHVLRHSVTGRRTWLYLPPGETPTAEHCAAVTRAERL